MTIRAGIAVLALFLCLKFIHFFRVFCSLSFTHKKKDSESFPSLIFFKNMLFLNAYLLQFSHHLEQEHDK